MEIEAYTIREFCEAHRISLAHYHNLRNAGKGPRVMRAGGRVIISREAASDWRKERERDAAEMDGKRPARGHGLAA